MKDKRTYKLQVRLSPAELDRLDALCAETGLSRADMARYATLGQSAADALAFGATLGGLLAEVGKIGSNINQIARHANTTGEVGQLDQLDELASLLAKTRRAIMAVREP